VSAVKYNPFSFLVEKFLAEELSTADAVEALAKDDAVMRAASATFQRALVAPRIVDGGEAASQFSRHVCKLPCKPISKLDMNWTPRPKRK
jgi:hypothetical protein